MLGYSKFLLPLQRQSPDGEMVDALVSGASVERRVGSSPILGTRSSSELLFLFSEQKSAEAPQTESSLGGAKKNRRESHDYRLSRRVAP